MTNNAPEFMADAAQPTTDLATIRDKVRQARDLQLEIEGMEQRLEERKASLTDMLEGELADIMRTARTKKFELDAEGNEPAFKAELKPYAHANISAKWPLEQRIAGYEYLETYDDGSGAELVVATVTVTFPKGAQDKAKELAAALTKKKYDVEMDFGVNHMSLSAWLRRCIEEEKPMPDLLKIGGRVGEAVKLTKLKG